MKPHEKFLQFKGRNIYFKEINGEFYIAIKPICDVLSLEYTRQFKNLKEDEILGELLAEQPMVGADNKMRKMICLPEKYIYGWLFSIKSNSQELKEYKKTCYDILFNYFRGSIIGRKELLKRKMEVETAITIAEKGLEDNEAYQAIVELRKEQSQINKSLKNNDRQIIENEINLFNL